MPLPGSSFSVLDAAGKEVPISGKTPDEGFAQVISWPLYIAGTYRVQAVATGDGPFELTIRASQDDAAVAEKTVGGTIRKGEIATVNVTASCADGKLAVLFEEPVYSPGIRVEPDEITLVVEAGRSYEVPFTIREAFSRTPLTSVTLGNEDIAGSVSKVAAGAIRFEPGSFALEPGGETRVVATIPVPQVFLGKATGRIVVRSAEGAAAVVNVTLKTPGSCPPHCNGIGPIVGLVGVPVVFDAGGSYDPDGQILHYAWDWDDDGDFEWTDQPVIQHTWDAPFTGKVRLVIFDNDDECADTYVEVTITNP